MPQTNLLNIGLVVVAAMLAVPVCKRWPRWTVSISTVFVTAPLALSAVWAHRWDSTILFLVANAVIISGNAFYIALKKKKVPPNRS